MRPTVQAYDLLARLYLKQGMDKEAEEAVTRAPALDPANTSLPQHQQEERCKGT